MKERLLRYALKYGTWVGYPIFWLTCLAIFALATFPYDKVKDRILFSYNEDQRTTGSLQELQIDEMSGYWLTGVRMKGIRLLSASPEPGKAPSELSVDEATVRYSILGALVGSSDLDFSADTFGGEVSGSFDSHGKDKSIDLTIDEIDVGQVGPLVQMLGVPLEGKLSGTIHLRLPDGKVSKATGSVSLESKGTAVGDGKAKIKGALALPRLNVGTLTLSGDAKDGVLKVTKLVAGGKDLDLQGDGRMTLRDTPSDSLCDLQVRFRINDAYRNKNDITKSLFGIPGSTAPALFELADPKIRQAKRPDGFYGWILRGPLSRLDFAPGSH